MDEGLSRRTAVGLLALFAAATVAPAGEQLEGGDSAGGRRLSFETATGTLASYDTMTRTLTVRNATGASEFHVAADARLWLGNRRIPVSQLQAHTGAQVTVAWAEVDGVKTTHTVRLEEPGAGRGR